MMGTSPNLRIWLHTILALVVYTLLLGAPGRADDAGQPSFDFSVPSMPLGDAVSWADPAPLWQYRDDSFQRGLEDSIAAIGLDGAVDSNRLGVALVDITHPDRPRVASVHGDVMRYAASLPKIAVMLAVFEAESNGDTYIDAEAEARLQRMIRRSSNVDSTLLMRQIGKDYIARVLRSPRYRLYDPNHNGGLWAGRDYAKAGLWKRDPLHNISHGATPMQVARFFYMLEEGRLVSPEASAEMKTLLADSAIHHKFVRGLEMHRPDAEIYRKAGTWRDYHADGALVKRDDVSYIAVALAESPQGGRWLSRLIIVMDRLVGKGAPGPVLRADSNGVRSQTVLGPEGTSPIHLRLRH